MYIYKREIWRIRSNLEINNLLKGEDIVKRIKSLRLSSLGHLERMEKERIKKKLL